MKIVKEYENHNKILNFEPKLINTELTFSGSNNILICDENVTILNSKIQFNGDNSIIYLSSNCNNYLLIVSIFNDSTLYIDENCYFNNLLFLILSESKNIFIGKDCLFSSGVWIRLADPHLIYDIDTMERINLSENIYIGDHVWIGQDSMLLKGSTIGSGSIVGAKSLISSKNVPSNSIWGGNPVRELRTNIFFDGQSVHAYTKKDTEQSMKYDSRKWVFEKDNSSTAFEKLDEFDNFTTVETKIQFLYNLRRNRNHNRFFL